MPSITPFLWFEGEAEEAAEFYVSIFPNSRIDDVSRYGDAGPGPSGSAMVVEFVLDGREMMAINGSPGAQPPSDGPQRGSIALYVGCATQAEVDRLWDRLCDGGKELQCGWVVDRFGVTWNVVPDGLSDYLGGDDPKGAQRAMQAMLQMRKLDVDAIRRAYEG